MKLAVEFITTPADGETENGDRPYYRAEGERCLFGVVDVLGHGPHAAEVARKAVRHLEEVEVTMDVERITVTLHEALKGTRGAAATLCVLEGREIRGCGVGNVEIRVQGSRVPIFLNPGILGQHVRRFHVFEGALRSGDRVVCFSDGISLRADLESVRRAATKNACELIFERHRKGHDDATILIADVDPLPASGKAPSHRSA